MTSRSFDVTRVVTMQLVLSDACVLPVTTELGFRADDPYTVRATFTGPHSMSTWLIGRELLAHGLLASQAAPAGGGDVQVWRDSDPEYMLLSLSGIEGTALLAAPAEDIEAFLTQTSEVVPFGTEEKTMESEITRLITTLLTA